MTNQYKPRGITTKHLIEGQIPAHIRESSPLIVKFLEYYYEFIERDQKIVQIIQDVLTYTDIDEVELDFLITFFEEYKILPNNIKSDPRLVAKHIYDLYQTKGSERSVKLLFRIIWGEEADIHYPSDQILRSSDGRWKQQRVITVTAISDQIERCNMLGYKNLFIDIHRIESVQGVYRIYFYYSYEIDFDVGESVRFYLDKQYIIAGKVQLMPGLITPITSSNHWLIGQHVYLNSLPHKFICKVLNVHQMGQIKNLDIVDYGDAIDLPNEIEFTSSMGQYVKVKVNKTTVARSDSNWSTHHGIISNIDTCLQDNFYYQLFSYVITARVMFREFYPQQKKIHPAGLKCFGNYEFYIDYVAKPKIESHLEYNIDVYLVDGSSPEEQIVFYLHVVLNKDFVVASSLREIDNYDLNNQLAYYDETIDWDVIPDTPFKVIEQYSKNADKHTYDFNDEVDGYDAAIDFDKIRVLEFGQYTLEDEFIDIVIIKG